MLVVKVLLTVSLYIYKKRKFEAACVRTDLTDYVGNGNEGTVHIGPGLLAVSCLHFKL